MKRRREDVAFSFLAVAFLLLSPVLIPLACLLHERDDRRKHAAADRFRCLTCGEILGVGSVLLADCEWSRCIEQLMRDHPGVKFRLEQTENCRTQYRYVEADRSFVMDASPVEHHAHVSYAYVSGTDASASGSPGR